MGRFRASARLLERAESLLERAADPTTVPARLPLRLGWVAAELAMVSGDGCGAVRHAERAADLARTSRSARHRVKTDMVLAAALCSAGNTARSRLVADDALAATGRHGLIPLRWALACLLADIGSDIHTPEQLHSIRDGCVVTVERAGGVWRL
jgi:ATP/maltotriose-dependent transcriptional regulator MalT